MEKVRTKSIHRFFLVIALSLVASCISGCRGSYYFNNNGTYICEDPYIEFVFPDSSGAMCIDGVTYHLNLGYSNNGTEIFLDNQLLLDQAGLGNSGYNIHSDQALIWRADTEEKNGKLYLTVTKDNVSDYEGKTIVLEFEPNEE